MRKGSLLLEPKLWARRSALNDTGAAAFALFEERPRRLRASARLFRLKW